MINSYIKYFFIILCVLYAYTKLLKPSLSTRHKVLFSAYSLFMPFLLYLSRIFIPYLTIILLVLSFTLLLFMHLNDFKLALTISLISYGIVYIFFCISVVLSCFVKYFITGLSYNSFDRILIHLFTGIFQLLFTILLFKIKNLRLGMPFLLNKFSNDLGIFICTLVLLISSFLTNYDGDNIIFISVVLSIPLFGLLFYFWWRRQLKSHFNHLVSERTRELLTAERDKYMAENKALAAIIHKDNKLIAAMEIAITEFMDSYNSDDAKATRQKADELICSLNDLSKERDGLAVNSQKKITFSHITNCIGIDSVISYSAAKADSFEEEFSFELLCDIDLLLNGLIKETDFKTLLADLLENAIIAAKNISKGKVYVNLTTTDGLFCLNIYDNGSPFDVEALLNFGIITYTGHKDSGGSGIGLMTTHSILSKIFASFELDETITGDFTKRVTICFDGLNQYRIKTTRDEVLKLNSIRGGIIYID